MQSQFGFRADQGMRLADHVTLNFNINISKAAVFMDIGETFDIT
jgi:hypothetical protein